MKLIAAVVISAVILPPLLIAAAIWDISRYWDDAQWEWEDE